MFTPLAAEETEGVETAAADASGEEAIARVLHDDDGEE